MTISGNAAGAAYVFDFDGTSWNESQKLLASDGAQFDLLGWSVSLSGERMLTGAPFDDGSGSNSGSAYIFIVPEVTPISCSDDLIISDFQAVPASNQFVEVTNVGTSSTSLNTCSINTFDVFTETAIGDASIALSGTLEAGATTQIAFGGALPAGFTAFGIYECASV